MALQIQLIHQKSCCPCNLIWSYRGVVYLLTDEGKTFLILRWSNSIIFFPLTGTTDHKVLWTVVSSMLLKFQVLRCHRNIASNYFFLMKMSQRYFLQEKNQERLRKDCIILAVKKKQNNKHPIPSPRIRTSLHYCKNLSFIYQKVPFGFVNPDVLLVNAAAERKGKENVTIHWAGQWHWSTLYQPFCSPIPKEVCTLYR